MTPSEQPCCGRSPQPAVIIEPEQIVQRPGQRMELAFESPDDEEPDAAGPAR